MTNVSTFPNPANSTDNWPRPRNSLNYPAPTTTCQTPRIPTSSSKKPTNGCVASNKSGGLGFLPFLFQRADDCRPAFHECHAGGGNRCSGLRETVSLLFAFGNQPVYAVDMQV